MKRSAKWSVPGGETLENEIFTETVKPGYGKKGLQMPLSAASIYS